MRRPNLCNNSVGVADDAYKPAQQPNKEEGRVSLMRRVLGGGKKKDGNNSAIVPKHFGVPLGDMPLTNHAIPKALHRMCSFIELYGMNVEGLFRLSGGSPALVEKLKHQFNTEGDADLESCSDVPSVASLLKIWLKDLPQPLLSQQITNELVSLMHKYEGDSWWGSVCFENLSTAGLIPTTVLETILHLLYNYTARHPATLSYIPGVFCPLLTCGEYRGIATPNTVVLTSKLIKDYKAIFNNKREVNGISDSVLGKGHQETNNIKQTTLVITENTHSQKQRKRKERNESCVRLERKFVRSNSEERPAIQNNSAENRAENIRRVSSHEDFSKAKHTPQSKIDPTQQTVMRSQVEPLHEHNGCSPQEPMSMVGYSSDLFDENEHERRRDSERFAQCHPHSVANRHRHRRAKHVRSQPTTHSKENEFVREKSKTKPIVGGSDGNVGMLMGVSEDNSADGAAEDSNGSSSTPTVSDPENGNTRTINQDDEYFPPSPISGAYSPILDLNTLKEVCSTEPVTSAPHWTNIAPSEERMASPRNSLVVSRRVFTAAISGHGLPDTENETSIIDVSTQITNLKRKLKRYEEGFEREFGYKPSHSDKMANPDTRKMTSLLGKLRKQLKYLKEESAKLAKEKSSSGPSLKEDVIFEIEKRLSEKRVAGGRGDILEKMSHDQLVDEKAAMQKTLLQLEATFGRPSSREDRDLVRPLYDRYRALKRILLRHAPSKLKDSVSELGTILEHETMDFSTSPTGNSPPRALSPAVVTTVEEEEEEGPPEPRKGLKLDNLHALPLSELLDLQRRTRDEKKRLRRELREFEMDYQNRTGRKLPKEDRHPLEPTYTNYKNAKAKLKFIDALVTKVK